MSSWGDEIVMTGASVSRLGRSQVVGGERPNGPQPSTSTKREYAASGEDEVTFVSEKLSSASSSARRSRAIESAKRFHDRHRTAIQRQAEIGRRKRKEFESKREKIQKELNQQNELEQRRATREAQSLRSLRSGPGVSHSSSSSSSASMSTRAPSISSTRRVRGASRSGNVDRDLEQLDLQREMFLSGLMSDHTRHQQEMEEYEMALAISLSIAEANGRQPGGGSEPGPGSSQATRPSQIQDQPRNSNTLESLIFQRPQYPTSYPGLHFPAMHSATAPTPRASSGGWETDGMSYEELTQLEDVKVVAPKYAIDNLETKVVSDKDLKDSDKTMCTICQCEFEKGEKTKRLPCGHLFHAECAEEWLGKYSKSCPVCKTNIC